MKVAIMGSGGVGGYYGTCLALAGNAVTFIARGAHLRAMRERGLRVESTVLGEVTLQPVETTDDPARVGPVELVLVATKTYDLDAAAERIGPMVGEDTVVIPLLNGIDAAERLARHVGADRVLGGLTYVSSNIVEPGVIRQAGRDRLLFGELAGGSSERARAVERVLREARVAVELSADIRRELWRKFTLMLGTSGIGVLTRVPMGVVRADPDLRRVFEGLLREVAQLSRQQGIALEAGTEAELAGWIDGMPDTLKASMLIDLERGRRLEIESLHGTAVRLARAAGLELPRCEAVYAAAKPHAQGSGPG